MANLTLDPKYTKGKGIGDAVQKKEAAVMAALRDNAQKVGEIARQVQAGEYAPQKEIERPRPSMGTILGNRRKAGIMAVQQATDQARRYAGALPESILPESQRTNRYYPMPEVEPEVEERWKQIQGLAGMVHVRENDLTAQQNMIKRHEEELAHNISQLEEIENQYNQNPTQYNADLYNQAYSVYLESYNKYNRACALFNADYNDYTPLRSQFDAAAAKYNGLIAYQQEKFEDWRGTIRDEETIQTEMDLIDRQIAAGWERFFNEPAEYKPGITEGHPEAVIPAEIQELQERRALLDEEYEWSQYYKYRDLMDAEDFTERSKYVSTANGKTQSAFDVMMGNYTGSNSGWDDPLYEYINGNKEAGAYISNQAANAYGGDSLAAAYGRTTENKGESQRMTEEEISIFNYIYATRGKQAAHEYYNYLLSDLNQRQRQKEERYWRYQAAVDPVGSSVFSILMSPTKGLSYLGQTLDYATTGKIDENAAYNKFVYTSNAIRNKVASNWGPVGSFAYQTAMSMGDFLLTAGITGGTNASLLIMGTGAAADTTLAAKDRGLTDAQAFALGTVAGVAEAACEKIGLDAMMEGLGFGRDAFGYFLQNAFSEAGEEGLTSAINLLADVVIAGDQSEWQMMIDDYVADGYTQSQAFGMVAGEMAARMGLDMLGGGLSGAAIGSGGAVINTQAQNNYYKGIYGDSAAELVAEGLESPEGTKSHQLALQYQKKLEAGEALSGGQIRKLVEANAQQIHTEELAAIRAERDDFLERYGLKLPSLDDASGVPQNGSVVPENSVGVPQNGDSVTEISNSVTPTIESVTTDTTADPGGIAEDLRQDQTMTGGDLNVQPEQYAQRPAAAQPGTQREAGAGVPDGSSQRNVGQSAGEQGGSLGSRTGQAAQRRKPSADEIRKRVYRQNLRRNIRTEPVSSKSLGVESGTDNATLIPVADEYLDDSLRAKAERVYQETRKKVVYVLGPIEMIGKDDKVRMARGATLEDCILVRMDHDILAEKIADHEAYHAMTDYYRRQDLDSLLVKRIRERFSREELDRVLEKYKFALRGIYSEDSNTEDVFEASGGEVIAKKDRPAMQELLADAHAGINAFGAGATKFTETVNEFLRENNVSREGSVENGTAVPTGPPSGQKENTAGYGGERYSVDEIKTGNRDPSEQRGADVKNVIYPGMSDFERANILENKTIIVPRYINEPGDYDIVDNFPDLTISDVKKELKRIGDKYSLFSRQYSSDDIDIIFEFSKGGVKESSDKQIAQKRSLQELGKLLRVLPQVCEGSIEVEQHTDQYADTYRYDQRLKVMRILAGAYDDGNDIVFVKLGIKEYKTESNMQNKLYVAITIDRINRKEAGIVHQRDRILKKEYGAWRTPASEYRLSNILPFVKDTTGDIVKYFPDQMLTEEQKAIKNDALQEDRVRLDDMRYEYAAGEGNRTVAENMLQERASAKGYSNKSDWRLNHHAPNAETGVSIADADRVYGGDGSIYGVMAHRYYGEGYRYDWKAISALSKVRNDPDAMITVYRAVGENVRGEKLQNGDWVSPTIEYAREHAEREFDNEYRIVSQEVPAKHLFTDGNSIHEYGYDNGQSDQVYKNTANNVKTTQITFDDSGKLIPLSKRYDDTVADERFSVDDESSTEAAKEELVEALRAMSPQEMMGDKVRELIDLYTEQKPTKPQTPKVDVDRGNLRRALTSTLGLSKEQSGKLSEVLDAYEDAVAPKRKRKELPKADVESKPTEAKKRFQKKMFEVFSVPAGQRAELNSYIASFADRIVKNGVLTEADRKAFFARMYEAGVVTVPADEYYAQGREYLKDGRIYVTDSLVADFGDDWADIRRRAFNAGIYLTRSQTAKDGSRNMGVDVWNAELSEQLPWLFGSEETDQRTMLEQIVKVAENGRDEQLSLAEYTALIAGEEFTSEDEVLDSLERQMEWAIKTFAQTAEVEIELKDRNMRRVLKERADNKAAAKNRAMDREFKDLQQKALRKLQELKKLERSASPEMKQKINDFLGDMDILAIRAANEMNWSGKYNTTWRNVVDMYNAAKSDKNFIPSKELDKLVGRLQGTHIADLDISALNDLLKATVALTTEIRNQKKVISDARDCMFEEVYVASIREIAGAPGKEDNGIGEHFNLDQLTPMNNIQRMVGWNPDSEFLLMFRSLEQGDRKTRAHYVLAQKMLEEFMETHKDWMKRCDGQGKKGIWYEVEVLGLAEDPELGKPLVFGEPRKVWMTPAQKVQLYLESKNYDNLRHMEAGRRFADKELYSQGKRKEAFKSGPKIKLTPETVRSLVSDLTEEEMELARILANYYDVVARKEINKTSQALYGYDKATEGHYAPIHTDGYVINLDPGMADKYPSSAGNLKERTHVKLGSENVSALDAFEKSVEQTALFVGMEIPLRNLKMLLNWTDARNASLWNVINEKWGEKSQEYIKNLLDRLMIGGKTQSNEPKTWIERRARKAESNYISATFGFNPSIVLKQLGSIPMAGAYLGAENVLRPKDLKGLKVSRDLISKYTRELDWRDMGYTTPETKFLKDNPNWLQTNKVTRFALSGGAITAMDTWAAKILWPWAENKVRREHPDLEIGTQEQIDKGESPFYKQVAREFDDALTRSQSVSDELHQSSMRKSRSVINRFLTLFRSDSAQAYNTLRQKIGEASYFKRTGQMERAKKARMQVGTAAGAIILNSVWSTAVSLLVAVWKKKDKRYRDDEGELTARSITDEMLNDIIGSFFGVIAGGEEIYEALGTWLTGEVWYGFESLTLETLSDIVQTVRGSLTSLSKVAQGANDVTENGGNLWEYLRKNNGLILSAIKDLAQAAAVYIPGLPASNVEAYLVGALKWISPELGAAYDDLFTDTNKSNLSGKEGTVLESGVGSILSDRHISESDDTVQALAELYEAGYRNAIPGNTPTKVTVNDEEKTLGAYQQQAYDNIWGATVSGALDDLVESDAFRDADQETRAKMLGRLYSYADDVAKAELFDDYEVDASYDKIQTISNAGLSLADTIAWTTETSGMKQAEKFELLREWDMPDRAKEAVIGTIIGTDMETESGNPSQYAKMQSAFDNGLEVDQYLDMRLSGADVEDYIEMTDGGMDSDTAFEFATEMERMEDREGEDLADLDKWRVCVDFSNDVDDQLVALSVVMSDSQYMKVEIANDFGVTPDAYVRLQEIKPRYDLDGNGSYKNAEVKAAIDSMDGYTIQQKAVLWQLATGSTSARNNPYNRNVGQQVIDARAAAKARAEQEDDNDFQKEIERQWSSNG